MIIHRRQVLLGAGAALLGLSPRAGRGEVKTASPTRIELRGSTSMLAVAQRVAEGFMAEHPDVLVVMSGGGAVRGLKSLVVGTADLAMATNMIPEDLEKVIKDRKLKLTRHDVYRDGVVPVVHPSNPIADLPMGKLRDIFRGAIGNWKEVGGKDVPIVVVSLPGTSGTFETFKREVLGDDAVVTPKAKVVGMKELEKTVVEGAIGYIGLHQVGGLKPLTVNGVAANAESIAAGRYPIRRQLSLYQREPREPADAVVSSFVAYFLAPDKGQAVVRALGDVPMK